MRGCLSLPFRLALLALLLLGGFVAWSHRDAIRRRIHSWTAEPSQPESTGWGSPARAPAVLQRIGSLARARADTVLLSATDVASLIAAGAAARAPGALDSIQVRLDRDDIEVHARVDTRKIPLSFGPLSSVIHDWENVEAGGRLLFRRAGLAEWQVSRTRIRGIPLPKDVLGRLLRSFRAGDASVVPLPLPPSVGGLRVSRAGLVLYGLAPAGPAQ
jgi:hypothetical protein